METDSTGHLTLTAITDRYIPMKLTVLYIDVAVVIVKLLVRMHEPCCNVLNAYKLVYCPPPSVT